MLDHRRLAELDAVAFRATRPYPWLNPEGVLREDAHRLLMETLPDVSLFERHFGETRAHGQRPHDRYALEYTPDLELAEPWRQFLAELQGREYVSFLRRMMGTRWLRLRFHWHYAPNGCSVSPHCDSRKKLGSHIFYLNTEKDWDPAWGGETLVLEDAGRFSRRSAPEIEDFDRVIESEALGNRSLLFRRGDSSWHAVREICCPEDRMRKVFIVVIDHHTPVHRVRELFRGRPTGY